jgi:hypothetical protein
MFDSKRRPTLAPQPLVTVIIRTMFYARKRQDHAHAV